jgi:hypothetical protein
MGSEIVMSESPIFQVRAVGSFIQKPGCPEDSVQALGTEDTLRLCKGECYHPDDERRMISRIEIVRIRPQISPDENIADLVDDPWRTFDCDPDPVGCAVSFTDPEFEVVGRESLYYARAYEQPTLGINAGNFRCERDEGGECTSVQLCPGPAGADDECLAEYEPRAWSSPIYLERADKSPLQRAQGTAAEDSPSNAGSGAS